MKKHVCAFVLLSILIGPTGLAAHGVGYEIDQGGVVVSAWYEGMTPEPMVNASVEVFGPGDQAAFQTGRTDRQGRFAFFPDRPGEWKAMINDRAGHALTAKVSVERDMMPEIRRHDRISPWSKLCTGIGVIFGIFGIFSLVRRRSHGGAPSVGDDAG